MIRGGRIGGRQAPGRVTAAIRTSAARAGSRLRRRFIHPLIVGLLTVAVLGTMAIWTGSDLLSREKIDRLNERSQLVKRLAQWAAIVDNPAAMQSATDRTPFQPGDPLGNEALLPQLQIAHSGDVIRVVALLDTAGHTTASYPRGNSIVPADLGQAWSAAWSGVPAVSPVFALHDGRVRATVVPVGRPRPWAVLVAVSTEESNLQFTNWITALLGVGRGSMSTVGPDGVPIASTEPGMLGRQVLSTADLSRSHAQRGGARIWETTENGRRITNITAVQPTTGYLTYFRQATDSLNADLRARRNQRNLTLLAFALTSVLSIVFVGLLRETAARRSRAGLCALFAAAHDIVLTTDLTGRLTFISPAIVPLLDHSQETWLGRKVADLVHPDDAHRLVRLIENPAAGSLLNIRMTAANGTSRWFDVATRHLSTRDGSGEVLITCHAVGKRKQLLDQLGYQARHDVLTGLCNRTAFEEQLEDALAAAGGVAVLFIDLDSFKPVNDTFGHAAGDRVLQVISGRIRTLLGPDDVAGRFGGDEFGVLLLRANEIAARTMAGRVIRAVREPILVDGYEVCVAASVGVALAVSRPSHSGRLLRAADEAMYKAKQAGPGRYAMADPPAAETTTLKAPAPSASVLLATDRIMPRSPVTRPRSMSFPALPRSPGPPRSPGASGSSPAGRTGHPLSPRRWRTTVREQLGRAIPLLVLGTVILAATAVTLEIENANRRRDEAQHTAETHSLVLRLAEYVADLGQPVRLIDPISRLPWSLTEPAVDQRVLASVSRSALAGPDTVLALVDLDGRPTAVQPTGATIPFPPRDRIWALARTSGINIPVFHLGDRVRAYSIVPIVRDGRSAAFLVMGRPGAGMPGAEMVRVFGGGGTGTSGTGEDTRIVIVDEAGRIALSDDPSAVGIALIDGTELRSIKPGQSRQVTVRNGGGHVAVAAAIPGHPTWGYLILQQNGPLPRDPRDNHAVGDLLLLGIVTVTFSGLTKMIFRGEQAVRRDRARLQTLLHESHDIIVNLDRAGRPTFISSAVESLLGYPVKAMIGLPLIDLVHPEDQAATRAFLADRQRGGPGSLLDVRMQTVNGDHRWFDIEAGAWRPASGPGCFDGGVLLTCHEISERRQLQEQLRKRATHDPLTGLPNRAALTEFLDQLAREQTPFAVLLIDLDDFKPINDTFGHQVGDDVLCTVATRLADVLAPGPSVASAGPVETIDPEMIDPEMIGPEMIRPEAHAGQAFRLGGDEFVIVLPGADPLTMRQTEQRVREFVEAPLTVAGNTLVVKATIGLASSQAVGGAGSHSPESVVRHADTDMYEAKTSARARRSISPAAR